MTWKTESRIYVVLFGLCLVLLLVGISVAIYYAKCCQLPIAGAPFLLAAFTLAMIGRAIAMRKIK
jgi:uncharacterized membrane protein YccF (DUF307 family)